MQDDKPTPQTTPTVILGFASYQDGRFELIVQDDISCEETTLKGQLDPVQFEVVDRILPTCVFVRARCANAKRPTETTLETKAEAIATAYRAGWQRANHEWQNWLDKNIPDWDAMAGIDLPSLPKEPT
jgi:hypothetical protein